MPPTTKEVLLLIYTQVKQHYQALSNSVYQYLGVKFRVAAVVLPRSAISRNPIVYFPE